MSPNSMHICLYSSNFIIGVSAYGPLFLIRLLTELYTSTLRVIFNPIYPYLTLSISFASFLKASDIVFFLLAMFELFFELFYFSLLVT